MQSYLWRSGVIVGVGVGMALGQERREELPETVVRAKRWVDEKRSETATKSETPVLETPQSISTVSRAEIEARGAQSVEQAVTYVPGVWTGVGGEDSRVDDVVIRGFEAGGFTNNVYLDGLRVAGGGQWTRSQFDLFGLERVEILKGPSSVLYGQVAPGGLVNLTSKRPTADPRHLLAFQYGSFDTWQAAADSGGPIDAEGDFSYRIAGLYREGGAQVDHTDLSRVFVAPSFSWRISEATRLTVLANYQDDHGGATYQFLPVAGTLVRAPLGRMKRDTFIGEPDFNTFDREQYSLGYELEHRLNEAWLLRQNLRFSNVETFYESIVAARTPPAPDGTMQRRAVRGIGEAHQVTADTRLEGKFDTGPVAHTLTAGFDVLRSDWDHGRSGANVSPINIFDPVYSGVGAVLAPQVRQEARETQLGYYLQDQLAWERWRLTTGVRYDRVENDLRNALTGTRTATEERELTGRAGLLYLFDNGFAPYGSYSTSFEPVSGTDAGGDPFHPSKGEQFEIGLKYEPERLDALFTLSAFHLTQTNVLTQDPANTTFQIQTGEVEVRGIELEGKAALAEGLSLAGGLAFMDSEITRSKQPGVKGNEMGGVPERTASLWLDYTFGEGWLEGLGIGAGARYVSGRYGDQANAFRIPSYVLFDAAVRYDFGKVNPALKGTRLALSVTNLEDKTYVAKAETEVSANYGPGRMLSLNLSYEW